MRTPRRATKPTSPAPTWQENCAHFRQIQMQVWDLQEDLLAHPCTRRPIWRRPKIHQGFYMLKFFCFQWSLGSRMPSKPKSKWFRWAAALRVTAGNCRGCATLLVPESHHKPKWSHGDTHNLLLPPSPPATVSQKQMGKLVSSIEIKQSPRLPLGMKGIVLRWFLQCRDRIKEEK